MPNANILTTIWGATFTDSKGNEIDYLGTWTLHITPIVNFFIIIFIQNLKVKEENKVKRKVLKMIGTKI